MRYSLISDMHLDHPQLKTPYDQLEQLVLVAGDCANGLLGLKWLQKLKNKGLTVFAVDGNHEHYGNVSQGRSAAATTRDFYNGLGQGHFMALGNGLHVIGTNGWYEVEDEEHWCGYMNDARCTGLRLGDVNELAKQEERRLSRLLSDLPEGDKAIVVTHTAPCYESLDPRYEGSAGNPYYVNPNMLGVIERHRQKIAVWHHGHTHAAVDVVKDGVRIITNPRGYPRENPDWRPLSLEWNGKTIERI